MRWGWIDNAAAAGRPETCRRGRLFCFLLALSAAVSAAEEGPWNIKLGAAAALSPEFPGASGVQVNPLPLIDITYRKRFFLNSRRGLGMMLIGQKLGELRYLAGIALDASRETRNQKEGRGLQEVDRTIEASIYGEVFFSAFSLQTELSQDLIGEGHDGLIFDIHLNYTDRVADVVRLRAGPYLRFVNGDYMNAFYSVTPEFSASSGRPVFDADGGLERYGIKISASYPLTAEWDAVGSIDYARLVDDARKSPVSNTRHQASVLVGFTYQF